MDQAWGLWISDCSLSMINEIGGIHFTDQNNSYFAWKINIGTGIFFLLSKQISQYFVCNNFSNAQSLPNSKYIADLSGSNIISKHLWYLQRHKRQRLRPQHANFVFDLDIFGLNWVQNGNILDTTVFMGTKGHFFRIKSSPGGCIRT